MSQTQRQIYFIGQPKVKLWGLPLLEWQIRAFKKFGLTHSAHAHAHTHTEPASHIFDAHYVLSNNLLKAFTECQATALVQGGVIIGVAGGAAALIGHPAKAAGALRIARPEDLVSSYDKALRKSERPSALDSRVVSPDDIMKEQFKGSYKGITDFVTKFIWPRPAYYVTRLCADLRLTPNMVTTMSLILTLAALYYFWQGQWALGFVTGWLMTFLDTVDGKLARTTMTFSAWGNIYDHGIDLIHPPFWYWAWFIGLGGHFLWPSVTSDPMTFALMAILIGYVVDRIIEGIFIAQHGFHIHVWRPINSGLRFIIARRNPNMFIFMIAIMFTPVWPEAGRWGFYAVAIWTWLCIVFNIGVVIIGSFKRGKIISWMDPS
jgi:phosphatidylglycerophosphate synthase